MTPPVWPGQPFPLGATWDGEGTNFSLFSENAERVELCLFDEDGARARRADRADRASCGTATSPASARVSATGTASTARTRRRRAPLQPAKLLLDPYAKAIEGPVRYDVANVLPYVPDGEDADLYLDDEDDADGDAEVRRRRPALRLGGRPATARRRGARPSSTRRTSRDSRSCIPTSARTCAARMRAWPREPAIEYLQRPRRHRRRAAARPPHRRRVVPRRARPHELLGLQLHRLLRAARAVRGDGHARRAGARVQGDGEGAPPRRHRGDPRRRLQPHRRGQPPRADARVPRHRQRRRTTGSCPTTRALHGLHRHAATASTRAPERAAADHGLAALLRGGVPRRRLPLRSRLGARRASSTRSTACRRVLRHHPPGPDPLAGEADRRAVGRRPGRLPGRQLPGALDGVERARTAT